MIRDLLARLSRCLSLSTQDSPPLRDAVASLLEAKKRAGRRPVHLTNLKQYLMAFARGREGQSVKTICAQDIEEWLVRHATPSGRATGINRISSLMSYCVRRGWIQSNPCKQIERITMDQVPPRILSSAQSEMLLRCCPKSVRPWVVLCLLCGLRPSEAERTTWGAVQLQRRCVVVDGSASKVRRRRIVPVRDSAHQWLILDWVKDDTPIVSSRSTLRRARTWAAREAGIVWSQDVLRHTFGSMMIAAGESTYAVADIMGTSPRILKTHYMELVDPEEAQRFWSILPSAE